MIGLETKGGKKIARTNKSAIMSWPSASDFFVLKPTPGLVLSPWHGAQGITHIKVLMNKPLLAAVFSVLAAVTVAPPALADPSATIGRPTTHTASMTDYYKCIGGTLAWA